MARAIRRNQRRNPQVAGFIPPKNPRPYIKTSHHLSFTGDVARSRANWSNFNAGVRSERARWQQYAGNGTMTAGVGAGEYVMGMVSVGILFFVIGWGLAEGKKAA